MRMVFTPTFSSDAVRFELSNRLSPDPVTIGSATVSHRLTGAAVVAHTTQRLHFGGAPGVTLQPGEVVISDPVRFQARAFRDVAVSLHVRGRAPAVDQHNVAMQTSYLTNNGTGDHTLDPTGAGFRRRTTSWFVVSGMEVTAAPHVGAVVAFGDSLTDGYVPDGGAWTDAGARYPDFLARRLQAQGADVAVVNSGVTGNRLRYDGFFPEFGRSGLSRLVADAARLRGVESVILLEGINDIGLAPSASHLDVIADLKTAIGVLHERGLRVYLGTLTPTGGAALPSYGGPQAAHIRSEVNRWIREEGRHLVEGVIDFDAVVRDPRDPSRLLPAFDSGDHIHPNPEGHRALADAVPLDPLVLHTRPRQACG